MMPPRLETVAARFRKEVQREFVDFLGCWVSVAGVMGGASAVLPPALSVVTEAVGDNSTGFAAALAASSLIAVTVLFFAFSQGEPEVPLRWGKYAICAAVVAWLILGAVWAAVTETVDGTRIVTGVALTEEARREITGGHVRDIAKELLMHFGYESGDAIWTFRDASRVVLIATGCAASGLLTGGISLLLLSRFIDARQRAAAEVTSGAGRR